MHLPVAKMKHVEEEVRFNPERNDDVAAIVRVNASYALPNGKGTQEITYQIPLTARVNIGNGYDVALWALLDHYTQPTSIVRPGIQSER